MKIALAQANNVVTLHAALAKLAAKQVANAAKNVHAQIKTVVIPLAAAARKAAAKKQVANANVVTNALAQTKNVVMLHAFVLERKNVAKKRKNAVKRKKDAVAEINKKI